MSENEESAAPDASATEDKIGAAEKKAADCLDQVLRLKAEFENTKKRLEKDRLDAIRFANEKLLADILPVVDDFDRAMSSLAERHDPEKVKQGLELAQTALHKTLERYGVETVKSVGTEFDPRFHEAVAAVPDPKAKDGAIVEEMQRGYLLNGRLLRPSRVKIVKHIEIRE